MLQKLSSHLWWAATVENIQKTYIITRKFYWTVLVYKTMKTKNLIHLLFNTNMNWKTYPAQGTVLGYGAISTEDPKEKQSN